MEKMNTFIEFFLKRILENKSGDKLPLYYSDNFRDMLYAINDDISKRLINIERIDDDDHSFVRTYIDIDSDSKDKISFIMVNKLKEVLPDIKDYRRGYINYKDVEVIFNARQRSTMKVNRFVNEVFNDDYKAETLTDEQKKYNREYGIKTKTQELEEFVNKFKALREPAEFEIIEGYDIIDAYNYTSYFTQGGTLGDSCMKSSRCNAYIEFYAKNKHKVSLLVLKDRESSDKIIGRALVWKLDDPDRIFMDRIYTNYYFDEEHFKNYAKKEGWLYKYKQNMNENEYIVDSKTDEKERMSMYIYNIIDHDYYPYMDTMKYFNPNDSTLTNEDHDRYKVLQDTYGGFEGGGLSYDELVELHYVNVLNEFRYYAQSYFPYGIWNFVDNDNFIEDYIDNEINYYYEDFENVIDMDYIYKYFENYDEDKLKKAIKEILDDLYDEETSSLDSLSDEEIYELIDNLDIKGEIAEQYTRDRYSDYSAKDLMEELYGERAVEELDDTVYDSIIGYVDEDACARDYANNEDENYLRELYE